MNNIMQTYPSPELKAQLSEIHKNREIEINASKIQLECTAEYVAKYLHMAIVDYQENLLEEEDVAMKIVQFNQSITILVEYIGYIGYNLVRFVGKDNSGKPMELIQHVQQLNFLLMAVQKPEPEIPKRTIGFVQD